MRRMVAAVGAGVVALSLGIGPPSGAEEQSRTSLLSFCGPGVSAPCIESATRDGVPVTSADPVWTLFLVPYNEGKSRFVRLHVQKDGSFELGLDALDDVWVVTVRTGSVVPRVVFGYAADATIERFPSPNRVTVTASPVRMTDNDECIPTWPWSCPHQAMNDFDGYLDVMATDYGAWTDTAQRESMYGMDYTTNVGLTSIPPEIVHDPATGRERLLIRMANHHLYSDATLFEGFAHLRIPNLFLRRVYGVDHPPSLTGSGIETAGTGSAATVSVMPEPGGGAMLVDIEGMRFSRKKIRISRGVITPTKPTDVRARRTPRRAKLRFTEARRRGSRITGYRAACVRGATILTGGAKDSPVLVKQLKPGRRYVCRVRALSKAGPGRWSVKVRV